MAYSKMSTVANNTRLKRGVLDILPCVPLDILCEVSPLVVYPVPAHHRLSDILFPAPNRSSRTRPHLKGISFLPSQEPSRLYLALSSKKRRWSPGATLGHE